MFWLTPNLFLTQIKGKPKTLQSRPKLVQLNYEKPVFIFCSVDISG